MGGFSLDTSELHNSLKVATLGLDGILFLARRSHFFRISDADISDKSKADYLAKGLVVFQVSWFVGQVICRKVAGLPISLLEFHAFVNIGCALLTNSLWFTKPLAIKTPSKVNRPDIEQVVAVMLLNAELEERPKFYLDIFEAPGSRPPAEKWLWCWIPNKPTLSINPHIPEHIFHKIPDRNVQIKATNNERSEKVFRGRDIVSHLDEPRCYLGCGCPWSDRDGLHRTNTTCPTFNVHVSKKDERRLDLVRQYIEAEYGIGPSVKIITPDPSPARSRLEITPSPSPNRDKQAPLTPRRPISHTSNPSTVSYAASSDLEAQNTDNDRGRPTTLPARFRTQEYLNSMRDSAIQGMPLHRVRCLNEVPANSIYSVLPNFDSSDVLDYGFTRLSRWRWWLTVTALLIVPSGYGAAHLFPVVTNFSFPTDSEKRVWWISCIFIMTLVAGPLAFATVKSLLSLVSGATSSSPTTKLARKREQKKLRVLRRILQGLATLYFVVWVMARAYLMVESFISLRREQAKIFETPQWNWLNYIPHI